MLLIFRYRVVRITRITHLGKVGELCGARQAEAAVPVAAPRVQLPLRGAAATVPVPCRHLVYAKKKTKSKKKTHYKATRMAASTLVWPRNAKKRIVIDIFVRMIHTYSKYNTVVF